MTKKKNIISKLFVAILALTLISCCFLGSTLARYTSSGNGSASVAVAEWKITTTTLNASAATEFGMLSPSQTGYGPGDQTNSTGKILVATIENAGDVNAKVTFTAGDIKLTGNAFDGTGYSWNNGLQGNGASETQVKGVFGVKWYYSTTEGATNATTEFPAAGVDLTADGGKIWIYGEVTWTTSYGSSPSNGVLEDAIDTWIGQNITSIGYDISFVAVQDSKQPTA